ncbi:MAG TPA: hypothetical protein VKB35_14805 [Ktedonobacteraceae bacterium]|nr:hypothetical protein [Ktedonobacteraceae bacterium]
MPSTSGISPHPLFFSGVRTPLTGYHASRSPAHQERETLTGCLLALFYEMLGCFRVEVWIQVDGPADPTWLRHQELRRLLIPERGA